MDLFDINIENYIFNTIGYLFCLLEYIIKPKINCYSHILFIQYKLHFFIII